MSDQQQNLHASFGNVDDSSLQGLDFFQDKPHFAVHKETAMINAEREMEEEQTRIKEALVKQ
jgi:hypothetical protein